MLHINEFNSKLDLISKYGKGNAHLIWIMGLYLDYPDLIELASESLTDDFDDKKIDFLRYDADMKRIVFAQGYFSDRNVDSAPANKASDLNTAAAWLFSGEISDIPSPLREQVSVCRKAIDDGEVEQIDLLYVHNLSESANVNKELKTVAGHLGKGTASTKGITIYYKEIGLKTAEELYTEQASQIIVKDSIECPAKIQYEVKGPNWSAAVLSIPGTWLREQFVTYGDRLFSANYRGFLGVSKIKKINLGIKNTAEKKPDNFWAYNNGITILTAEYKASKRGKHTKLTGISIINGAQTTGSIGSLEEIFLSGVNVLSRIIQCSDRETIDEIIRYNNTQNRITTWDKFSNDATQKNIKEEFIKFGIEYSLKRGFSDNIGELGIEVVAQPLVAILGSYNDANSGKNKIFEGDTLYNFAFENKKARHILFAYCISRAIDEKRTMLRDKKNREGLIEMEEQQLLILRNLRFKYLFMAIFGKCLEVLLGKKTDIKLVGFNPSIIKNNSIENLVNQLMPAITTVLSYTNTFLNANNISDVMAEENPADNVAKKVSTTIYNLISFGSNPIIDDFRKLVS